MTLSGVLDPAWKQDAGGGGKGADAHYDLADVETMAWQYRASPPWNDVGPGLLFMWATTLALCSNGHSAPHQLARALGFRICASWIWVKVDDLTADAIVVGENAAEYGGEALARFWAATGRGLYTHPARNGIGQYQECEHEFLFLCRRGDFELDQYEAIRAVRDRSVIYAPRVKDASGVLVHSAKPPKAYTQTIEPVLRAAFPSVRPIEFNCRNRRNGWSAYGRLNGETLPDGKPAPLIYEVGED